MSALYIYFLLQFVLIWYSHIIWSYFYIWKVLIGGIIYYLLSFSSFVHLHVNYWDYCSVCIFLVRSYVMPHIFGIITLDRHLGVVKWFWVDDIAFYDINQCGCEYGFEKFSLSLLEVKKTVIHISDFFYAIIGIKTELMK